MENVSFASEDFDNLEFIEKFNEEHWRAEPAEVGWKYDLDKNDPQIKRVKESLHKIKNKLSKIGEHIHRKNSFKDLSLSIQKITDGRTSRYLSHLWIYFYNNLEKRAPNEPQLQFSIDLRNIDISLWFENKFACTKYLKKFIEEYSDYIKRDDNISIEVYESKLVAKQLNSFSNKEWDNFLDKINELEYDCKVGFKYIISKKEVLKQKENIVPLSEKYMDKMKTYFDKAIQTGEKFIIAHIEWNDHGWEKPQIPENPSFGYAKEGNMPHDTLNFKFDKPIDTKDRIYGFFQPGRGIPREFVESTQDNKIVFFYSRYKIVGIYGDANFLEEKKRFESKEFKEGMYHSNLSARRNLSLGFIKDAYLEANQEHLDNKRMGRSNFIYIKPKNAEKIILDAIEKYKEILKREPGNNKAQDHIRKLKKLLKTQSIGYKYTDKYIKNFIDLIKKKKQVIFFGPPGTGKTFKTKEVAVKLLNK